MGNRAGTKPNLTVAMFLQELDTVTRHLAVLVESAEGLDRANVPQAARDDLREARWRVEAASTAIRSA